MNLALQNMTLQKRLFIALALDFAKRVFIALVTRSQKLFGARFALEGSGLRHVLPLVNDAVAIQATLVAKPLVAFSTTVRGQML
jgi:hypothetical protein